MATAFRLLPAPPCCVLLALLIAPPVASAETIYAITPYDDDEFHLALLRFDSASPAILEGFVPIQGALESYSGATLEFDFATHTLYGFGYLECQILCPPFPVLPVGIDPFTGHSSTLDWLEFPGLDAWQSDYDVDPMTRELRFGGYGNRNFHFDLDDLTLVEDEPFDLEGDVHALAHVPPGGGGSAGETFAIVFLGAPGEYWLARIGGPQGIPPASSGEVNLIGELVIQGAVRGFDISEAGAAYFTTFDFGSGSLGWTNLNRLYRVDLATAAVEELGIIAGPDPNTFISGIAVAPVGLEPQILAIPSLSPLGLALLALALAGVALVCLSARRRIGTTR